MVLYVEELRWLRDLCGNSHRWKGRKLQLGSIRGGARTVICSLISDGLGRMLELRLFAPFGRRLVMIPELEDGAGWDFFANIIGNFIPRSSPSPTKPPLFFGSAKPQNAANPTSGPKTSRSYLQVAALPEWNASTIRSSFNKKHVIVNYDDAVKSSHCLKRCLVGSLGGSNTVKLDITKIQKWVQKKWSIPGGVTVKELDEDRYLFIFPSENTAIQILKDDHFIEGEPLLFDTWNSWSCCSRKGWSPKAVWIKVVM